MPIATTLIDTEGFDWDFLSDRTVTANGATQAGLVVLDGETDAFDNGMQLRVNGVGINPQNASLDENGRELNGVPVLVGEIAVARSILVSDATISATGFARFLESFTNTSGVTQTITVEVASNSGADSGLLIPRTTSGDGTLTTADVGFVTDDVNTVAVDTAVAYIYGDGMAQFPSATLLVGDVTVITHTITLAPGETKSLLSFGTQSVTAAEAIADLDRFDVDAVGLQSAGFLAGLSRAEQLSIVNYSGFDLVQKPFTLTDADGNDWAIGRNGEISTLGTTAFVANISPGLVQNFPTFLGATVDDANQEVTVKTGGFAPAPAATVSYAYRALETEGVIRLLITADNPGNASISFVLGGVDFFSFVVGAANASLVAQHFQSGGPQNGLVSGAVLDDSSSGSGGVLPAVTVAFGAIDPADTVFVAGSTLSYDSDAFFVGAQSTASLLLYFAINDTGIEALLDLERLTTPGPEQLAGLTNAQLADIRNFTLTQADRLQVTVGNGLDNVMAGHDWGDSLDGGAGDDDLNGEGSDDILIGGDGNDVLDGGLGADTLNGGVGEDIILGGAGNDQIAGGIGDDVLHGNAGSDQLTGLDGNDRIAGGAAADGLNGSAGDDRMFGGLGADQLDGGLGADRLTGGAGADRFVFASFSDVIRAGLTSRDVVMDFGVGPDKLDMSLIDPLTGTPTNEAFTFVGSGPITGVGQVGFAHSGGFTDIIVRLSGAGSFNVIQLVGTIDLTVGDFML